MHIHGINQPVNDQGKIAWFTSTRGANCDDHRWILFSKGAKESFYPQITTQWCKFGQLVWLSIVVSAADTLSKSTWRFPSSGEWFQLSARSAKWEAAELQPEINWANLNLCPPYTEIFSKRRKICSVCVEGLSYRSETECSCHIWVWNSRHVMRLHLLKKDRMTQKT